MIQDVLDNLDQAYTLRVLKEMISIPSVVGQEKALAEYLYCELESLGLVCEMHEVEPGRPNVYASMAFAPFPRASSSITPEKDNSPGRRCPEAAKARITFRIQAMPPFMSQTPGP